MCLCFLSCGKGKDGEAETSIPYVDPEELLSPDKLEKRDCRTLGHVLSRPTCQKAATCYYCGYTEGGLGAHDWTHATCKQRSTCTVCGEQTGELAPHRFTEASCAGPASCVYCGLTTGSAKAHSFRSATCVSPSMCSGCMQKQGKALGHIWTGGSCTEDKVCTRCGRRQKAPGHSMQGGSCTEDSVCSVCGWREAAPGHQFENGVCTRCGRTRTEADREEATRTTAPVSEPESTTAPPEIVRLQNWNDALAQYLEQAYAQADEAVSGGDFETEKEIAASAVETLGKAMDVLREMEDYSKAYPSLSAVAALLPPIRRAIADAAKPKNFYEATFRDSVLTIRKAAYDGQQGLPKLVKAIAAAEKAAKQNA